MKVKKNKLSVLDRALIVYRNPDDFLYDSFLAEEVENLGAVSIYILTGIDTFTRNRGKVLKFIGENGNESETTNGVQRARENGITD
jgi:hypothetical protein